MPVPTPKTGNPMWDIALPLGISILGGIFHNKSSKRGNRLIDAQANLAEIAAQVFKQQSAMDLPYRKNLYESLVGRSRKQFPRILPEQPGPGLNPFAGANKPQYDPTTMGTGNRQNDFHSILSALNQSRQGP